MTPGSVPARGPELVVAIDPGGTVDAAEDDQKRLPETGRLAAGDRAGPTFDLVIVPFLRQANPDSSIIAVANALSPDDELVQMTWTPLAVPHEPGQMFGLAHAPRGNPLGVDPSYPYPDGSIGARRYDHGSGTVVPPSTPGLMAYCGSEWISDYHFGKAMGQRTVWSNQPPPRLRTSGNFVRPFACRGIQDLILMPGDLLPALHQMPAGAGLAGLVSPAGRPLIWP